MPRAKKLTHAQRKAARLPGAVRIPTRWREMFIAKLGETSNVTQSATHAGLATTTTAYDERRRNPEFAAQWLAALREGYTHLEMELLAYLRGQDQDRKIDVANALRLLAAHSKTVAAQRADEEEEDEEAILASINAKLDAMREREREFDRSIAEEKLHRIGPDGDD